ncbi:TetR/AcrR family transcriptional regulator [Secundilactobacillus hailunensis]|uniref:TetR/AcrR family transcriptional regulator n=1 Tax=Secundilactobacillus hailunensis TaxID=2559923 RepID=A0ABW1T814_9LACO|nr:TetR/AcrR family transcriptional regulator C-terminal domain-containing protein [Secundilactobacillus hailunensis]
MLQSSQKLLTALVTLLDDKPLTKITTLDLIRTAGISRSTFYRHFQDKLRFFDWVKSYLLDLFLKDDFSDDTPASYYTRFFQHFADYRPAFKSFILDGHWQNFEREILKSGINNYSHLLTNHLDESAPINTIAAYIVSAHIGVVIDWLTEDDGHSPAQMAVIITQFTNSVLANYDLTLDTLMTK